MYQLFCDSNCELWYTTVAELGLNVIRMPYTLDGKEYFYDMGEKTDFKAFLDRMRAGSVPKTSALNEYSYTEYFEPVLARGEDIYYVTFSHKMSATFNAMDAAIAKLKEKYPERKIMTKDAKTISLGSGFVTYYAALKKREGATMEELDAYLDELIPHTATYFVVDDLTYLHRGGRISGPAAAIGTMLKICPVMDVNSEGTLIVRRKAVGRKKALNDLFNCMCEQAEGGMNYSGKCYICHSMMDAEANQLKAMVEGDNAKGIGLCNLGRRIAGMYRDGRVDVYSKAGCGTAVIMEFGTLKEL